MHAPDPRSRRFMAGGLGVVWSSETRSLSVGLCAPVREGTPQREPAPAHVVEEDHTSPDPAFKKLRDRDAGAYLARDPVPRRDLLEHLVVGRARRHPQRTARVEAAARGRADRARHVALENDALALP